MFLYFVRQIKSKEQCNIDSVSNQRELLIDFQLWEQYSSNKGLTIKSRMLEKE